MDKKKVIFWSVAGGLTILVGYFVYGVLTRKKEENTDTGTDTNSTDTTKPNTTTGNVSQNTGVAGGINWAKKGTVDKGVVLKRGDKGASVAELQKVMGIRPIDGIFGAETEKALMFIYGAKQATISQVIGCIKAGVCK